MKQDGTGKACALGKSEHTLLARSLCRKEDDEEVSGKSDPAHFSPLLRFSWNSSALFHFLLIVCPCVQGPLHGSRSHDRDGALQRFSVSLQDLCSLGVCSLVPRPTVIDARRAYRSEAAASCSSFDRSHVDRRTRSC